MDLNVNRKFSTCAVEIQWFARMQFIAVQAGHWINNALPNEQNADVKADTVSA